MVATLDVYEQVCIVPYHYGLQERLVAGVEVIGVLLLKEDTYRKGRTGFPPQ